MRRVGLILTLSLFALSASIGCSGDDAAEAEEVGEVGEATADAAPVAKTPLRASERAYGDWVIVMSDTEKRRQAIQLLAIADPPASSEDIKALEMSPEEQTQFQFTQMALEQGEPEMVAEMREVISSLDKATLTVTADAMTMRFGAVEDVATYAVVNETQAGALIKSRREGEPETTFDLSFPDKDTLRLANVAESEDVMTFRRQ